MFLPVSKKDMEKRGWDRADFIIITGDAYVDHPSFGTAIISRLLEDEGFRVAIISQPSMKSDEEFTRLGTPKYAFLVNSGNLDSMVAHYTAAKRRRSEDFYSPGKKAGRRPDRAVIEYSKRLRKIYGDSVDIVIGGLEASLRRFAHYDYWDDSVRRSVLIDSTADLLIYGMGEKPICEIAHRLEKGERAAGMTDIKGTGCIVSEKSGEYIELPSYTKVLSSKHSYAESSKIEYNEHDPIRGHRLYQRYDNEYLLINPPPLPLSREELDRVYELPYERTYHPSYENMGGVPAIEEVEFSITHNRGCFGACNFCSLAFHQGRIITSRSKESVIREARLLATKPNFKGYIHDVGGPTANFRYPACKKQEKLGVCKSKKCLAPQPCPNLIADHSEYLDILREMRQIKGIKKVFIRSGIRFDYLLCDKDDSFFKDLVEYHVSGQLKVAPEHCSNHVLDYMGKPKIEVFEEFKRKYFKFCSDCGKEQYLVPYLMSSHPGSRLEDAVELALFLKRNKIHPQQVQDFYPTPGTISTAMYYTGLDPFTLKPVFVPKTSEEKELQRALLQWYKPENREKIVKALKIVKRYDLIGTGKNALVPPVNKPVYKGSDKERNKKWHGANRQKRKRK